MSIRAAIALVLLALISAPSYADLVLRQSTASQAVLIGPFVDETDGNTPETELTIGASDVRLSKNGADIVAKNSGGCTHDELGYYACTFDATDSNTVGRLQVIVHKSGARPVYHAFQVAEEAIYDACCAADAEPLSDAALQSASAAALGEYDPPTRAELTSDINGLLTSQRIVTGTCDSGSTTTCADNALTQASASQLQDRLICFDDSWCGMITTFDPSSDTVTTTKVAPSTRASKGYTIFPATVE